MSGSMTTNNNAPNTETTSQLDQVTSAPSDGTNIGQSATDPIAFYGSIPQTQKASSIQSLASAGASSSASFFGAKAVNATSWTAQKCQTTALTAAQSTAALGTAAAQLLAECVDTLVGLGLWKGGA